ncbi:MAG: amidohydrolase family protein [Bacteroidota bacterium]
MNQNLILYFIMTFAYQMSIKISRRILFVLLITCTIGYQFGLAQSIALKGGTIINPDGSIIKSATVLIKDDKITKVGSGSRVRIPSGTEVIDISGKWIIPGLIDSHVHFFQSGGLYTRPDAIDLNSVRPYPQELQWIDDNLGRTFARYIKCGVTSVVDVGGPLSNADIKKLASATDLAPRVAAAGPLLSTISRETLDAGDPPIVKINSLEDAKKLIAKHKELQLDLIKIWYIVPRGQTPETNFEKVKNWVKVSHKEGFRVAIHAQELETAKAAIRAGADILVHSVDDKEIDDEFIQLVKKNKVICTTSMVVLEGYGEVFTQQIRLTPQEFELGDEQVIKTFFDLREIDERKIPERVRQLIHLKRPLAQNEVVLKNLKKMVDNGITVAMGTDAGNIGTLHGPSIFREFELMTQAGLTPLQIIKSATINSAKLMGREKDLGSIQQGKLADLVILNMNPLADIMNTSNIYRIVKDGKVFNPAEILPKTPESIVAQQVNAYNARDLEVFLSYYSDDVKIYEFPDDLMLESKKEIVPRYVERFKSTELHARIINRMVVGNKVIDREQVTGRNDGKVSNLVAIYEINDEGLISKVWFVR